MQIRGKTNKTNIILLASVALINTGKNRGFFKKHQCQYDTLLNDFFGSSCAPGALDLAHGGGLEGLCSLCRSNVTQIVSPSTSISLTHSESPPLIRTQHGEWPKKETIVTKNIDQICI